MIRTRLWIVLIVGVGVAVGVAPSCAEAQAKPKKVAAVDASDEKEADSAAQSRTSFTTGSSDVIIDFVNQQIRQGWVDNEIEPSEVASDEEWIRRVYLDILGHIPPSADVTAFVEDRDDAKRSKLIDKLLDDPDYVRNWTTIWSNLLIGRQPPRRVSQAGMQKFLREAFAKNRPWNEIVFDITSAEGHFERNGAVNYLLAQMTMADEGVQATAKTTKLFLGMQVQCTQCHDHPFNDWKQARFWEFNSFFRQMRRIDHRKFDEKSGRQVDDYSELVRADFEGPVFYEKRSGLMVAASPAFFDIKVDDSLDTDRRAALARFMVEGEKPLIAQAFVNRTWGQFMGYGFTRPVDDMGPHNSPSHPEVLDRLSEEFVKSGYDIKQLVRWICNSEPYNLTSQFNSKNESDDPSAGEIPLFSHMYPKALQAEQLYDSLIVATQAHKSGSAGWEQAESQRQRWMQQFVIAFGTDEGDEATIFNGTIPQALMMMNGELTQNAINTAPGSYLHSVLSQKGSDNQKVKELYLASLGRAPTSREFSTAGKLIKVNRDKVIAYQDLFWALLNSNEFMTNH
ncbi:MAG: DUF1549 and DUF1553 domain-containing protein [Planctomycetota bacterium]|nr:DUF1549 and DUF1553 domain-containing protein [Planctomycetota bacterium]MDA1211737.1 DUF1549 and DUF1553 domain-containing protein [Planctomycetota bacterium]